MRVEQYGITYDRITVNDLELIRYWRNQSFIRSQMQFNKYITPSMQLSWFDSINNPYNYYFLIEYEGKKIGLINCKDTEPNSRIAEGGIFIWNKNYWGTPIPVFASLSMLEAVFEVFQTGDASVITVNRDNKRALEFNQLLGYDEDKKNSTVDFIRMNLSKQRYFEVSPKLKNAANIFSGGKDKMIVSGQPSDNNVKEINELLQRVNTR